MPLLFIAEIISLYFVIVKISYNGSIIEATSFRGEFTNLETRKEYI